MKKNYLIGLGGSGGKVITALYKRIYAEHGLEYALNNVECIAIDTDQEELNKLSDLGVKSVCISGAESVGQIINQLGGDVFDWCPNTANEGSFYNSSLYNGASQCRLKSRLAFSNFLKNENNELYKILEESRKVSPHGEAVEDSVPTILVVSSIAGGTGSGIFIQTALYIKQFFRKYNLDVQIHGLFACPALYRNAVSHPEIPKIYANAYAVVRELNAFNLICGGKNKSAFDYDIDIEISSSCEGKLFEKDSEGRYGDKPYDNMYFIDKINYLSRTLGELENYYQAMADIAYSHLYTDISGEVLSNESNELDRRSKVPTAIYGSAGAATLRYPYEDIVEYFASRSIEESVSSVWSVIDKKWAEHLEAKQAAAVASGRRKYTPEEDERANTYIADFDSMTKVQVFDNGEWSFLRRMVENEGVCFADDLIDTIVARARAEVQNNDIIKKNKSVYGLDRLSDLCSNVNMSIEEFAKTNEDKNIFSAIKNIDSGLETYCKKSLECVANVSIDFANKIYCDNSNIWDSYDRDETSINVVNNLIYNPNTEEWVHPLAARYLLYKFSSGIDAKIEDIFSAIDTPDDDLNDFYATLKKSYIETHLKHLATSDDEDQSNAEILEKMVVKFRGKKRAKENVDDYFRTLRSKLEGIDNIISNALLYFSLVRVNNRIKKLIEVYETFFDNIDDFIDKAKSTTKTSLNKHDKSVTNVYVCASADIKEYLYDRYAGSLSADEGDASSDINQAIFGSLRLKASVSDMTGNKIKANKTAAKLNKSSIFDTTLDLVVKNAKNNIAIRDNLDINVFDAIKLEYKLLNPESEDNIENYTDTEHHPEAKNKVDRFIISKFSSLTKSAAPCLMFDRKDTYSAIFPKEDEAPAEEYSVANSYRYISHNSEVSESIRNLVGGVNTEIAVRTYYSAMSAALPGDAEGYGVNIACVDSNKVDRYSILCYSTVHCLQPYQIGAFNELGGGEYYKHYADIIESMEREQIYSLTPHIDKNWHKHGRMPYINVSKENEHRTELAKAFLYALTFGAIGYNMTGSYAQLVYADPSLRRSPEVMFYDGKPIPYNKINRAMSWLADDEALVRVYANRFDEAVEAELEKLVKYSETVAKYKTGITNYAQLFRQMKFNILRAVQLHAAKNGKVKALKEKESIGILELAWLLHNSEESELDKDYGELIIKVLCDTIKKYAKEPYNAKKIESKDVNSEAYINYTDVCAHIAKSFIQGYDVSGKAEPKKEKKAKAKTSNKKAFGVSDENLTIISNDDKIDAKAIGEYAWAVSEIDKYIELDK